MKVSLNLVKKYVDLEGLTIDEIAHRLTFAGVEVEGYEKLASGTNLVVGQVLTCENMPDSDHLHLTTVNAGSKYGVLHIVCGAPNVRKGLKVIVATDGAILPGGTIKKGAIRGHTSEGMLCSLLELGVDSKFLSEKQTKGIEELPDSYEVGNENVLSLLGLDDVVLDLKLLANRSDLYSILNVAKEMETLFERKTNLPNVKVTSNLKEAVPVNSKTEKCPQFSSRLVKNITVKESPSWLKDALRSSGIRSINNIVDIGNYVMLLTGQPLHMYDYDKLSKKELIVRDDIECDFVALDEKTYKVQKGDICITSDGKVMCLGGIMGSLACSVDEKTKNVVVEAANFDYASIRRTSIRLNLSSDSSMRFVKGINPNQYNFVMDLTAQLLLDLCDAKEVGNVETYLKSKYEQKIIKSFYKYINDRLGTSFTNSEIKNALERAFILVKENVNEFDAYIPDARIDIKEEADLSEEVIRILGFEHVKSELPNMQLSVGGLEENLQKKRLIRNYLRGIGIDEVLSYSLIREKEVKQFAILNKDEPYKVMNPLTDEHEFVRTNLLPSLMNVLTYNLNHQNENLAFFEVSDLFSKEGKKCIHLGLVVEGNDQRRFALNNEAYNFYHLRGVVDNIFALFDIDEKRIQVERANLKEFHPGKSAIVKLDGKVVAVYGELHPLTKKSYHLERENVLVLEMDLGIVFSTKTSQKKMNHISRFPSVKRDFALLLQDKVTSKEVITEIKKINRELISRVEVFDVYKGEHIKEGYYSLAISVYFGSMEKTLSEQEITEIEKKVIDTLEAKFAAELRK